MSLTPSQHLDTADYYLTGATEYASDDTVRTELLMASISHGILGVLGAMLATAPAPSEPTTSP